MLACSDRTRADLNKVSNAKRIAKLVRLYYSVLQRCPTYRWLSIPSGLVVTLAPTEWNGTRRCASASQRHFLPSGLIASPRLACGCAALRSAGDRAPELQRLIAAGGRARCEGGYAR